MELIPGLVFCWLFLFSPKEENKSDQQNESSAVLKDQQVLNVRSYADLFSKSVKTLSLHLAEKADGEALIWDKVSLPSINYMCNTNISRADSISFQNDTT